MPYCSRCGVELHKEIKRCPLCRAEIQQFPHETDRGYPFPPDELPVPKPPRMTPKERRRLTTVLTALGIMIPILITLSVDLTLSDGISWSFYPTASLFASFLIVLSSLYIHHRPLTMILLDTLIVAGTVIFLFFQELLPGRLLSRILPLLLLAMLFGQLTTWLCLKASRKGGNIGAFILLGSGFFCLFSKLLMDIINRKSLRPGWTLIVLAATVPVALILLYLHYRRKEGFLRRYFHI